MESAGLTLMVFVILAFLVGVITRYQLKGTSIPYSVALLVLGLVIGYLARTGFLGEEQGMLRQGVEMAANIDPELILFLFLPALIFESAYAMEVHLFRRMFFQIAVLAVPGLIVSTLLTALLSKYLLPFEWAWPIAFMFGALISATDPVAVVALLKEMSSRKRLETLIEGESLMNDGTAIVFFTLFYSMVLATGAAEAPSMLEISFSFLKVVILGAGIGLLLGAWCLLWLGKVFNDATIEIVITIIGAYMAFFIAEHFFHVSGVVSVVTFALLLAGVGRTRISPEVAHSLHHFWEMVSYMFNTLIFLIVGILVAERVAFDQPQLWLALAILYVGIQLIRAFSVTFFSPVLSRIGIGINREKATVLIWGGLRGAVSLALALAVVQNDAISQPVRDQILFLTCGIVVMTILINGGTIRLLLRSLGLDRLPAAKQATIDHAKKRVQQDVSKLQLTLSRDEFLQHVKWHEVEQRLFKVEQAIEKQVNQGDLEVAFKRQILESERKFYWKQYQLGLLTSHSVNRLVEAVESALDGDPVIGPRHQLMQLWQIPNWLQTAIKIPLISSFANSKHFRYLTITCNTARGFIQSQQALLDLVNDIAPSEALKHKITEQIEHNIQQAQQLLAQLRRDHNEAASQIETQCATRLLLNRQRDSLHKLAKEGVIDAAEAEKLVQEVEREMHLLQKGS